MKKKGEAILYVEIKKDLFGLMSSALLFYLKQVKDLEYFGL